MTDIVKRLRERADAASIRWIDTPTGILREAATEIERLRHVEADHKQLLDRLRQMLAN